MTFRTYLIVIILILITGCVPKPGYSGTITAPGLEDIKYRLITIDGREYIATRISGESSGWCLCPKLEAKAEK